MVKAIVDMNDAKAHIPDYTFELEGDLFIMRPRGEFSGIYAKPETIESVDKIILSETAYNTARKHCGGYDLYFLEREWRSMLSDKKTIPDNSGGSFVSFVKRYVERNGQARTLI